MAREVPLTDAESQRTGKVSLEDKKRQIGSVVFSAEMLNPPIGRESAIFQRQFFRTRPYEEVEKICARNFLTIDTKATDAGGVYSAATNGESGSVARAPASLALPAKMPRRPPDVRFAEHDEWHHTRNEYVTHFF